LPRSNHAGAVRRSRWTAARSSAFPAAVRRPACRRCWDRPKPELQTDSSPLLHGRLSSRFQTVLGPATGVHPMAAPASALPHPFKPPRLPGCSISTFCLKRLQCRDDKKRGKSAPPWRQGTRALPKHVNRQAVGLTGASRATSQRSQAE
jgi:hypothetical protein